MPFFQGASNINIGNSTFNDVAGNQTYTDSSNHSTITNSNNTTTTDNSSTINDTSVHHSTGGTAPTSQHSQAVEDPQDDPLPVEPKYNLSPQLETAINGIVGDVLKICPIVLIDVKSGRLCDAPLRTRTFRADPEFKDLVTSMTHDVDNGRIRQVVAKYFQYVTFSHVWEGDEPSLQLVRSAKSVWKLGPAPLNNKLRKFCEVVREDGYRWAWSDTCCIDKTISTVLNESLKMMYKWYEASAATFAFLFDVDSESGEGSLKDSKWMTRAWTSQELLAPKLIRFYDRKWKPYLGDMRANHKESPQIMQELANTIGISREIIKAFNPDDLSVREKLRLASTRNATREEDVAYSLIGIFKSDIRPEYGERDAALGHLLEEIVARAGEVTVLAWISESLSASSSYNTCLPATLAVYKHVPFTSPVITNAEMDQRVAALRKSLSREAAMQIHSKITRLPLAQFSARRLHLPSIIFPVNRLGVQDLESGRELLYRAWVSGIGNVEFHTSDKLPLAEPRKLILVHPWIRDLRDPLDGFDRQDMLHGDEANEGDSVPPSPLGADPSPTMDGYTRALRLVVRLQQPFFALLLQQQPNGEFRRVACERAIVVPGVDSQIDFARDVFTEVIEIL